MISALKITTVIDEIVGKVLEKKELSGINPEVAEKIVKEHLTKKVTELARNKRFRNKEYKNFIKIVRAQLRKQYGAFQNPAINREELIRKRDYTGLLKSHQSTKERLKFYPEFYKSIFAVTGKPESIIEIGCGMHPLSLECSGIGKVEYLAADISMKDLKIVQEYFNQNKRIKGRTLLFDAVRDEYNFRKKYDLCFVLKLFEILETTKSHRLTEDIVNQLPAKWVAASFSTKTLSNKPMTRARRIWFEVMLKRLKKNFEIIRIPNEIIYVFKQ